MRALCAASGWTVDAVYTDNATSGTAEGKIDTTTADGGFRASMLTAIAGFETWRKSERSAPGRRRYAFETDAITPRQEEGEVVRWMFAEILRHGDVTEIRRQLLERGTPPSTGDKT